jgi:hypothetical protein
LRLMKAGVPRVGCMPLLDRAIAADIQAALYFHGSLP